MFYDLCHSPTRKSQFLRSGYRGRWGYPMCGIAEDTGASPGSGHEAVTPAEMVLVRRHQRRLPALRERQVVERAQSPSRTARTSVGAVVGFAALPRPTPATAAALPTPEASPPGPAQPQGRGAHANGSDRNACFKNSGVLK